MGDGPQSAKPNETPVDSSSTGEQGDASRPIVANKDKLLPSASESRTATTAPEQALPAAFPDISLTEQKENHGERSIKERNLPSMAELNAAIKNSQCIGDGRYAMVYDIPGYPDLVVRASLSFINSKGNLKPEFAQLDTQPVLLDDPFKGRIHVGQGVAVYHQEGKDSITVLRKQEGDTVWLKAPVAERQSHADKVLKAAAEMPQLVDHPVYGRIDPYVALLHDDRLLAEMGGIIDWNRNNLLINAGKGFGFVDVGAPKGKTLEQGSLSLASMIINSGITEFYKINSESMAASRQIILERMYQASQSQGLEFFPPYLEDKGVYDQLLALSGYQGDELRQISNRFRPAPAIESKVSYKTLKQTVILALHSMEPEQLGLSEFLHPQIMDRANEFGNRAAPLVKYYLTNSASILFHKGQIPAAKERLLQAESFLVSRNLQYRREYADVLIPLAVVAEKEGNLALAEDYYKRALEVDGRGETARLVLGRYENILRSTGRLQGASSVNPATISAVTEGTADSVEQTDSHTGDNFDNKMNELEAAGAELCRTPSAMRTTELKNQISENLEQRMKLTERRIHHLLEPIAVLDATKRELDDRIKEHCPDNENPLYDTMLINFGNLSPEQLASLQELRQLGIERQPIVDQLKTLGSRLRESGVEQQILSLQKQYRTLQIAAAAEHGNMAPTNRNVIGLDRETGHLSQSAGSAGKPYIFRNPKGYADGVAIHVNIQDGMPHEDMTDLLSGTGGFTGTGRLPRGSGHSFEFHNDNPDRLGYHQATGYIALPFSPDMPKNFHQANLDHEIGHGIDFEYFRSLPESQQRPVDKAYENWLNSSETINRLGADTYNENVSGLLNGEYFYKTGNFDLYIACRAEMFAYLRNVHRFEKHAASEGKTYTYPQLIEVGVNHPRLAEFLGNAQELYDALKHNVFEPYDRGPNNNLHPVSSIEIDGEDRNQDSDAHVVADTIVSIIAETHPQSGSAAAKADSAQESPLAELSEELTVDAANTGTIESISVLESAALDETVRSDSETFEPAKQAVSTAPLVAVKDNGKIVYTRKDAHGNETEHNLVDILELYEPAVKELRKLHEEKPDDPVLQAKLKIAEENLANLQLGDPSNPLYVRTLQELRSAEHMRPVFEHMQAEAERLHAQGERAGHAPSSARSKGAIVSNLLHGAMRSQIAARILEFLIK